jgi:hypothetical protein
MTLVKRVGSYTAWLLAVDASAPAAKAGLPLELDQVLLKEWSFEVVQDPEKFKVSGWEPNPTGRKGVNASALTDPTPVQNRIYGVDGRYQFAPITILNATGLYTGNNYDGITFTFKGVPGFLIDPADGFISGTPTEAGNFTMQIKAIDGDGAESELAEVVFDVRKGPNGRPCSNTGTIVGDDAGITFTCDCTGTGFEGKNCEESIAEREAKEEAAGSDVKAAESEALSKTIAAAAGGIILLVLIIGAALKYRQYRIAMRPIDFSSIFHGMVESGEISGDVIQAMADNQGAVVPMFTDFSILRRMT